MHREISHTDPAFQQESRSSLYLLTGLLALIIAADLWPFVATWLDGLGISLPRWPNEYLGYRLALVAAALGGLRALYGSIDSLLQGKLGADLALAIAAVAAILVREPLVAAEIVFVGLLGECLESVTFERTQRALRRIVEICPRRCWRLRDGREERVLTTELQVGDVVVVKPGGRVPADGVVRDGRSAVDTSALTGESLPVDKGPGDEVLAGSLNQQGALTIECQRVAKQTVVGQVIELTSKALRDKAPLERTADRLDRWFLPVVLGVATLTFLVGLAAHFFAWGRPAEAPRLDLAASARLAAYPALSVLVVSCPCALILATPAAIIAALGRLAGTGVLIKGGSALERLAGVDTFFFDKTGTLTEGRLEMGEVVPLGDIPPGELLRLTASAEQKSEHPLGRLIVQETLSRGLSLEEVQEFQAHPGAGVSARLTSGAVLVGNRRLLEEQGIPLTPEGQAALHRLDAAGQTVLLVCLDGRLVGALGARDRVRPEAKGVLLELGQLGITRLAMLTGDREAVAKNVAATLGLSEYHAELLPQDKAELVATAQQNGRVAMVGDGINDAPALARSTVGIALGGSGADVAAEAGDVVLMIAAAPAPARPASLTPPAPPSTDITDRPVGGSGEPAAALLPVPGPLRSLPLLVRLSRETVRIIWQNILVFAFGVNIAGVVLTAWLWPLFAPPTWYAHGPLAAVIYHQLASLAVLLNSMRLLWFERRPLGVQSGAADGLSEKLRRINGWMDTRLDIDEALHWASHQWKPILAGTLALFLLAYLASGLVVVGPDEVAVVRQFGRPLPADLGPGLHWCYPWPVESVVRIQPRRVRTVEVGFRTRPGSSGFQGPRGWATAHSGDGVRRVPEEAVLLTGDGNLLELQGSVRYTVADPRTFLFDVQDPEGVLRNATESVLREVVAGTSMADLLTRNRARFQDEARRRLEARCAEYGSRGLGLHIEGVSLHDLHPPQEVVGAYHEVTRAMEARDRMVNDATADAMARKKQQEARSLQTIRLAEADCYQKVRDARARLAEFEARYHARSALSWAEEWELVLEALQEWGAGQPAEVVARTYQTKRGEARARQEALVDFRLYWERVGAALAGRSKVVIDADRVAGRRHLWFVPADPFAPPAGMFLPRRGAREEERGPRVPPRSPGARDESGEP